MLLSCQGVPNSDKSNCNSNLFVQKNHFYGVMSFIWSFPIKLFLNNLLVPWRIEFSAVIVLTSNPPTMFGLYIVLQTLTLTHPKSVLLIDIFFGSFIASFYEDFFRTFQSIFCRLDLACRIFCSLSSISSTYISS